MLFIPALFALLGLTIGSFLNVVIDRLPAGQSLVSPPSHCPVCQRRLSVGDLIPVFSFIWLRGRCRTCGAKIPPRILWVELASGVTFGLLAWWLGLEPELAVALFYFCIWLTIAVIDLEHQLVMINIVLPAVVVTLLFSIFLSNLDVVPNIASAAIGGAIGLGVFLIIYLIAYAIYRGKGFGLGDVYLATLMGLMLGSPRIGVGILLSVWIGGISAVILLALRAKGLKQAVPFGLFLALGAFTALLWGQPILDWYLRLFGMA